MRNLFIAISLLLAGVTIAQDPKNRIDTTMASYDSIMEQVKRTNASIDSMNRKIEAERFAENNQRGLDYLLELQKEQRAKQKRNAIVRISIGVVLLIVLFIGLRRRKKM